MLGFAYFQKLIGVDSGYRLTHTGRPRDFDIGNF